MLKNLFIAILLSAPLAFSSANSVQMLADPDLGNTRTWKAIGETCQREQHDGKTTLLLQLSGKEENGRASWRSTTILPIEGERGLINIVFEAEILDIIPQKADDLWGGFVVLVHGHKNGKYVNVKGSRICASGSASWKEYVVKAGLPEGMEDLYVEFVLARASGSVRIRNASMEMVLLSQDERQNVIKTKVVGGREVELIKVPRHPLANASLETSEKDFVFFDGNNTRQIYATTVPGRDMLISRAEGFGTPGEWRRIFVGLHALRDLPVQAIRLSPLKSEQGKIIEESSIEVFCVHEWAQSDGMGSSLSYSVIPEVLLPFQGVELKARTSVNLLFRVKIPEEAAPGIYDGSIFFSFDGVERELPLALRILPFSLLRPANDRICYLSHVGDFGDTIEDAVQACLEFKTSGIEGLVMACQYGKGMLKLKKNDANIPVIDSFHKMDQALAGYKTAKMTGPLILHFSDQLEIAVASAMGFEVPKGHEAGGINAAMKTPEFSTAMQKVLAEIKEKCAGTDLYIMCIDEPGAFIDRRERALWQCKEIQKAGMRAAVYQYGSFWKQLQDFCPLQIFSSTPIPGQTRQETALEVKAAGVKAYSYGIHGSYKGCAGGIMPSRARSGFMAHAEAFAGQTFWLYAVGNPTSFNGTKQLTFFPRLKYRGLDGGLHTTLQWEGLCEGVNDFAYMNTLDEMLSKHKEKKIAKEITAQHEKLKNKLQEQISTAGKTEEAAASFSNRTADAVRWQIAEWILLLQEKELQR